MNAKCAQRHHDVEHLQSHRRSIVVLSATHERVLVVVDLSLYSALPPGWLSPPPCAGELAGQDAPCRSQALAPPTVCAPCLALLALSGHDRVWASLATARELDGHDVVGRSPPPAPPSFSALMPVSPAGLSTILLRVFVRLMYCCFCTEVFDCGRTHP